MKSLVVYYSRTGTTKKMAEEIIRQLGCDSEQILDKKSRAGPIGFIFAGKEAAQKALPEIVETKKNPIDYDTVIIGTPVWAGTLSSPVRTYITLNAKKLKKIAFFCAKGGEGQTKAFEEMGIVCGKKPFATLELRGVEIMQGTQSQKIKDFVEKIKSC